MLKQLDKDYITIILIPLVICILAIVNAETPKEKQGRYFSCLERYDEQKCHVILK